MQDYIGSAAFPNHVIVYPSDKAIYTASTPNFTPAATATDMMTIVGSATKLVRVLYIFCYTVQTTAGINQLFISKRSSDNTGGTFAGVGTIPHDSNDPISTAELRLYSANPASLGNLVGGISVYRPRLCTPTALSTYQSEFIWDFTRNGVIKGMVLRGTSELLSVNNNGNAVPAGFNINMHVIWSEE